MSCPLICPGLGLTAVHWFPLICPGFGGGAAAQNSTYMSWFGRWGEGFGAEGAKIWDVPLKYKISTYMSCPLICPGLGLTAVHWFSLICPGLEGGEAAQNFTYMSWSFICPGLEALQSLSLICPGTYKWKTTVPTSQIPVSYGAGAQIIWWRAGKDVPNSIFFHSQC